MQEQIVEAVTKQLEGRADELSKSIVAEGERALRELESTKQVLVEQVKTMAELKTPTDLLSLFLKTNGGVYISKAIAWRPGSRIDARLEGWDLFPTLWGQHDKPQVFRFVLIALPQDVEPDKKGYIEVLC